MASIQKIGRALIQRGGTRRCQTVGTRQQSQSWAATIEDEIDQIKASGFMKPGALTIGDLIDRYTRELYPVKQWSPSKTRDLRIVPRGVRQ